MSILSSIINFELTITYDLKWKPKFIFFCLFGVRSLFSFETIMLGRSAWPVTHCVNQGGLKLASSPVILPVLHTRAGVEASACLGV